MAVDGFRITLFADLQALAEEVGVAVDLDAFDAEAVLDGRAYPTDFTDEGGSARPFEIAPQ